MTDELSDDRLIERLRDMRDLDGLMAQVSSLAIGAYAEAFEHLYSAVERHLRGESDHGELLGDLMASVGRLTPETPPAKVHGGLWCVWDGADGPSATLEVQVVTVSADRKTAVVAHGATTVTVPTDTLTAICPVPGMFGRCGSPLLPDYSCAIHGMAPA